MYRRGRRKTAQEAHRAQGAKCLERESQDVDEIIIIDDPVLQTINVSPSVCEFRYFIFRGGRARVRAQEEPDSRS